MRRPEHLPVADATFAGMPAAPNADGTVPTHPCEDCGTPLVGQTGYPSCPDCEEKRERIRERRMLAQATRRALPERYRWCRFDAPELAARVKDPSALDKAKAALEADRVLLAGAAGLGKTVLACCILVAWAERHGAEGVFADAYQLGGARALHALGEGEPELVRRALRAPALVVDDLGADRPTLHNNAIPEIIHERHAHMRRTIVTTGYSREELAGRYGDGILRQLREGASIIELQARRTP